MNLKNNLLRIKQKNLLLKKIDLTKLEENKKISILKPYDGNLIPVRLKKEKKYGWIDINSGNFILNKFKGKVNSFKNGVSFIRRGDGLLNFFNEKQEILKTIVDVRNVIFLENSILVNRYYSGSMLFDYKLNLILDEFTQNDFILNRFLDISYSKTGEDYLYDTKKNKSFLIKNLDYIYLSSDEKNIIIVLNNNKMKLYNIQKEIVIDKEYDDIEFLNNYILCKTKNEWSLLDENFNLIISNFIDYSEEKKYLVLHFKDFDLIYLKENKQIISCKSYSNILASTNKYILLYFEDIFDNRIKKIYTIEGDFFCELNGFISDVKKNAITISEGSNKIYLDFNGNFYSKYRDVPK